MIGAFGYNSKLREANNRVQEVRVEVKGVEHRFDKLEKRVDELSLLSQALWELVRDHTDLKDEDIREKMKEIDTRGGKEANHKINKETVACENCGRKILSSATKCFYCGTSRDKEHVFEV